MAVLLLVPRVGAQAAPAIPDLPVGGFPIDIPPSISARGWILFDDSYDLTLGANQADEPLPMASTTKIMTALVALEHGVPGHTVTVSTAATEAGEAEIGLEPGERIPLETLVKVMLIRSANDAAIAVAEDIAGSVEGFVGLMNQRADELGLTNTHFVNPHGLDHPDQYSSPADLLAMAQTAMEVPAFAQAVGLTRASFPAASDGTPRPVQATNHMLTDYPGAIGVKTGFTLQAGLVLVAAVERDGHRLYAVVMGSEGEGGHFADASALLDYGYVSYGLLAMISQGRRYAFGIAEDAQPIVAARARVQTLTHLAAAGILVPQLRPIPPELRLDENSSGSDPLPGLSDSVRWVERYWEWVLELG